MTAEKAKKAAALARSELNHPIFLAAPGAKKAIQAMADALEWLAHEVAILKSRANAHAEEIDRICGGNDGW